MHIQNQPVKVGVTEPEFWKAQSVFARADENGCHCVVLPPAEEELATGLREQEIHYVIVGVGSYRGPLYEALRPGGVIARFGVGHDGVDKQQATGKGLLCTNTPGVLDDSVAEHTIGLLLALARQTLEQAYRVRAGQWSPRMGVELRGKLLAVLGCGGIGRRVARLAARAFSMEVVGLRRSLAPAVLAPVEFGRTVTSFEEAVKGADFVSLHLPSVPETRHYLDRSRFERLPAGSFLINTARGALVDEIALYDILAEGRLAGAALDVFEDEPYKPRMPEKDLRRFANVIMTPHIASSTREACDRIARRALGNIRLAVAGQYADMDLLNPEVLRRFGASKTTPGE